MEFDKPMLAAKPFLRWPGGKRWLFGEINKFVKDIKYQRYLEPFVGGGAIFFALQPKKAVLSDVNSDLVLTYNMVKNRVDDLIHELKQLPIDKDTYYSVRSSTPTEDLPRAVRFLYLNRTAFAGMYRVNKAGLFNVPYGEGRKVDILWKNCMLQNASRILESVDIFESDFESILEGTGPNDLVYCDPTYTVAHNNNGFVRYNEKVFSWKDQVRLAEAADRAVKRGATVIVSNAAHHSIQDLYNPYIPQKVNRYSCISRNGSGRKSVEEFLFVLGGR